MNNNERFFIGNGHFLSIMQGLSIKEIRNEHDSLSFCSLDFINDEPATTFTKSQRIYDTARWHTRLLKVLNKGTNEELLIYPAEIDDRIFYDSGLLIRTFRNSVPLCFKLRIPPYARLVKAPSVVLDTHRTESYWVKISYENYEEILQLSCYGECKFDIPTMTFSAANGESALIISTGTIPASVQRNTLKAFGHYIKENLPEPILPYTYDKNEKVRNVIYSLYAHSVNNFGLMSSTNDTFIRLLPLYTAIRLFNQTGLQRFALSISVNSLKAFLTNKDCVAVAKNHSLQYATDIFSLMPSIILLLAFEAPNERFLSDMKSFMVARCKLQTKSVTAGMLPFEGREYYYNNFCQITDGSAISTLFYIKSTELLCKYANDKEIKEVSEFAKGSFRDNFVNNGKVYLNNPIRTQRSRLPKYIFGICDFCKEDTFTWLTKNSAGAYCCDNCADEFKSKSAPNYGVKKESYLPVLWSEYLDMDIFNSEEISYAQDLAVKELYTIPLCDAALLLYSMSKNHHKACRQVYDHILSKQNSLNLWLDDKGEFDVLTNSLCAYAIINTKL
ncbi:MAG: hypothetical protein E7591_09805 [Ruminococcaceae bacterium]|nr:hypothetical protein [Oscillospiraceae bacterium]